MKSNKPRKHENKPQNQYGGDYECENFEERSGGIEWCHDEGQQGWREWIKWAKSENGELRCKGNRHNCYKEKLKWIASLSDKEKERYLDGKK